MLSKEQQKQKNSEFWDGFKQYMRGNMSVTGRRVNWLKYPTELKDVYLRLEASGKGCAVHFDIQCKDSGVRSVVWEQMGELRAVMQAEMEMEGDWQEGLIGPSGMVFDRISWGNSDVNYFSERDIPEIYGFLKNVLLRFDRFYQEYKDILIALLD